MIKLVLIDFDDTLCLTEKACFRIENDVAQNSADGVAIL